MTRDTSHVTRGDTNLGDEPEVAMVPRVEAAKGHILQIVEILITGNPVAVLPMHEICLDFIVNYAKY